MLSLFKIDGEVAASVWLKSDIICRDSLLYCSKREFYLLLTVTSGNSHWDFYFTDTSISLWVSSVFIVTLESVCEQVKGFSGKDPATAGFEGGILKYYRSDPQVVITINKAWLCGPGRSFWERGRGTQSCPRRVLPRCEDALGEQRPSLECIPIYLQGG